METYDLDEMPSLIASNINYSGVWIDLKDDFTYIDGYVFMNK